jgi:heptosyltransferase-2
MNQQYNNILVIQTAFIGDAVLSSSVLEKLHKQFPNASLSIVVRAGNEGLFQSHPYLKEVLIWEKRNHKLKHLYQLLLTIRQKKFDCVIDCHRYLSSGLLAGFSGARHISGFKQNPLSFLFNRTARHVIGDGRHETARYQELIDDLAPGAICRPRLYPTAVDIAAIESYQKQSYVCIAPASVWYTKQLPAAKWNELIDKIPKHITIYLLGAPGDAPLCESIKAKVSNKAVIILAGKLTYLSACALMEKALMNYVNDSSPLHFASAVNAPVTVFFCSTVPSFGFGPLSDKQQIIEKEMACRPCGIRGYAACPKGHFNCGNQLKLPDFDVSILSKIN